MSQIDQCSRWFRFRLRAEFEIRYAALWLEMLASKLTGRPS
jgi:hypothetical protein